MGVLHYGEKPPTLDIVVPEHRCLRGCVKHADNSPRMLYHRVTSPRITVIAHRMSKHNAPMPPLCQRTLYYRISLCEAFVKQIKRLSHCGGRLIYYFMSVAKKFLNSCHCESRKHSGRGNLALPPPLSLRGA